MIRVVTQDQASINTLKPAFRACPNDFDVMKHEIEAGRVSIYRIQGEGVDCLLAGEVRGQTYFIWAAVGTNALKATRVLSEFVKKNQLTAMACHSYFPLVVRLLKRLGGVTETAHGDAKYLKWRL
ncbi:DNAase [Vibrio sp. SCSIO 43140]|uniref:DNAase n=1 Tax=Vibrio sp. SCSIO 43140 TaxID=2819100 RepID=UPI0020758DE4|nr:DNAase [Vibrio sp. SCSIO 43140]USD60784.1 DNAase [Vibrio sp. SCSIO 43140]